MVYREYVSGFYWSNCLIEAVKAKLSDWKRVKIYFCKPRWTENGNFQMCHFLWSDGEYSYDFSDREERELGLLENLWYEGRIRRFPKSFARSYSGYRNRKRDKEAWKREYTCEFKGKDEDEEDSKYTK